MALNFSVLSLSLLLWVAQAQGRQIGHINNTEKLLPNNICEGKEYGYYPHPTMCTHYVLCTNQETAFEIECGEGVDESGRSQRLHFVAESGPDPKTARCDSPSVARCGPDPPTTTTKKPGTCDPEDCQLKGECRDYEKCVEDAPGVGHLVGLKCGADLFWDPIRSAAHGGICVYFDNLDSATQKKYKSDRECIPPCDWFQTDEQQCSPRYTYRERFQGSTEDREQVLQCPDPPAGKPKLFWSNDERRTCVKCSEAIDNNKRKCGC